MEARCDAGFEQRSIDELPFARVVAVLESGENSHRTEHPGHNIADGCPALEWWMIGTVAGHAHQAAHALRDQVDACPVRIGSRRAEAGNRQINQTRVDVPQVFIPKAEFWHGLAQKILNQNIRAFDHATENSFAYLILQVDGDAALIAVDHHEGRGFTLNWRDETARGVAPILSIDGHPVPQDEDMTHRLRTWAGFEN